MKRLWIVPMLLLAMLSGTIGAGWGAMRLVQGSPQSSRATRAAEFQNAIRAYDASITAEDIQKATEVIRTWKAQGRRRAEVEKKLFDFCDHDTGNGEVRDLVNCRQALRLLIAEVYQEPAPN